MNELEKKKKDLNFLIEAMKQDIRDLGGDLQVAKSWKVKGYIEGEIRTVKNRIERKEFELWKLERGDE